MDERPDGYRASAAPTPYRRPWLRRAARRVVARALAFVRMRRACGHCGRVRPMRRLRFIHEADELRCVGSCESA